MKFTHTLATLIIAVVVTMPVVTQAAATDFLKTFFSLPYATQEDSRLAFPDELTVNSWGSPDAQEVAPEILAERAMMGVVPLRPGTHLVKFGNSPRVYAVSEGGTLHWIPAEKDAIYLYGDSWSDRIVTLFESYYVNYTFGQDVATTHPNGMIFKYPERPTVYYLQSGVMRPFMSEEAFYANHFSFDSVVTVYHPYGYSEGAPIAGYESSFALQSI